MQRPKQSIKGLQNLITTAHPIDKSKATFLRHLDFRLPAQAQSA